MKVLTLGLVDRARREDPECRATDLLSTAICTRAADHSGRYESGDPDFGFVWVDE